MKLSSMSYKGYVWPHNPENCDIRAQRAVALTKLPGGAWHTADLGRSARTITGSGAFSGEDAYSRYLELYEIFCQEGAGELYHPVIGSVTAIFTSLTLTQEPSANYAAYSFTFVEFGEKAQIKVVETQPAAQAYHTLSAGETFWTVCALFSLTPMALAALNPRIPNPARVRGGHTLRVA